MGIIAKARLWISGSVRHQLVVVLLIPLILSIITIAYFQYNEWHARLEENLLFEAERNAIFMATGIAEDVHTLSDPLLQQQLDRIIAADHSEMGNSLMRLVTVAVIKPDGSLVGRPNTGLNAATDSLSGSLTSGISDTVKDTRSSFSYIDKTAALLIAYAPVYRAGEYAGGILSEYDLKPLIAEQAATVKTFLFRISISCVICLLLALVIARRLTNPLTMITKSVNELGNGRFAIPALVTRNDEYQLLTRALIQADERIYKANAQLHDEIKERHGVAQNLMERENLLSNILDNLPMPVFIKRADDLSYFRINKRCEKVTGFSNTEIVGKTDYDIWPRAEAELYISEDREALQQGKLKEITEQPLHSRDGQLLWMHTRKLPIFDDNGKPLFLLGIADDITERKQMEAEIKLAATVFENSSEGIIITDKDNNILSVNNAFEHLTGYTRAEVKGKNPRILKSGRQDAAFYQDMWRSIINNGSWHGELWERRKDGSIYPKWLTINAIKNDAGEITNFMSIFSDISERKKAEERIYYLAHHDTLTGLANRMLLGDRIRQAIHQARRSGKHLAILFIDLDEFKVINDTLGHDVGDAMLRSVSDRLQALVRETDTVARMGGDEFVILLSDIGHEEDAARVAEKVVASISEPYHINKQELHTSPSIGISMFPQDGNDEFSLIRTADTAMYHAKANGRKNFQFYTSSMHEQVLERLTLERGLRQTLETGAFDIDYQPQVNVQTGQIIGFEAFVRWQLPQWGTIPPEKFIPIAEESGIIVQMGEWTLRKVCEQIVTWRNTGAGDIRISVNISERQLWNYDFIQLIKDILEDTGAEPSCLELELTEATLLQYRPNKEHELHELRDLGVKIAIDDFGTGYSSLPYLKRLPLDRLKIDQSFVKELGQNSESEAIVTAMIKLAESMDIELLAEGVETTAARDFLLQQGCHIMQGFLFGKPKQADAWNDQILAGKLSNLG